jgi:hypothetical protein
MSASKLKPGAKLSPALASAAQPGITSTSIAGRHRLIPAVWPEIVTVGRGSDTERAARPTR